MPAPTRLSHAPFAYPARVLPQPSEVLRVLRVLLPTNMTSREWGFVGKCPRVPDGQPLLSLLYYRTAKPLSQAYFPTGKHPQNPQNLPQPLSTQKRRPRQDAGSAQVGAGHPCQPARHFLAVRWSARRHDGDGAFAPWAAAAARKSGLPPSLSLPQGGNVQLRHLGRCWRTVVCDGVPRPCPT
jgi:hypothetical protein